MSESGKSNPLEGSIFSRDYKPMPGENSKKNKTGEVNKTGKTETKAVSEVTEQQHKDVKGMIEKFIKWADNSFKWNDLRNARAALRDIKNKTSRVEFYGKEVLESAEAQQSDIVYTGQEIKITARDEDTGEMVKAEFLLVVDADKKSQNYGKYKLVSANSDAERLA